LGAASAKNDLYYIGSVGGMEGRIVANESRLPFRALPAAALRGRGPHELLKGAATMSAGVTAARRLIDELQPVAILGTGGYVCVPLFLAARMAGVPTMMYLPDVVPGLAVRFLARIATLTACNVEDAARHLKRQAVDARDYIGELPPRALLVTGYPVRQELFHIDRIMARRAFELSAPLPVLLVYGGSRGARSINRAIEALLPRLLEHSQIIHVCGREGDETWLDAAARRLPAALRQRYRLYPYLETGSAPTMIDAFGAADLTICRSGASTLAELPAAGLPAVLVPYPYVHQDENADYLVQRGAALKIADDAMLGNEPSQGPLFTQVVRLLTTKHERQQMAARSRALARPDAAERLAEALLSLAKRSVKR
jgi:UDP-N-acetylglucosamine--N-acetylmuramyl-(pentapeptide) pyrophosphoryl-undecaprenol N-acetylglucosamine transferase